MSMQGAKAEYYSKDTYYNRNKFLAQALLHGGYNGYEKFEDPKLWKWKVDEIMKFKRSGRALDIGCAYGAFLAALPDSFERYGIDISADAVKYANKHHPEMKVVRGDIDKGFPFKGGFDVITMFDTVEHLYDLNCSLKRVGKALSQGGYLFVLVPVASRFNSLLHLLRLSLLWSDDSHVNILHKEAWLKLFSEFFDVVKHSPLTYSGRYIPGCEVYGFFVLRKKAAGKKAKKA